jgi:hypothetical protein
MSLFKVNIGLREQEVCGLKWADEIEVPEVNTSVFIIEGARRTHEPDCGGREGLRWRVPHFSRNHLVTATSGRSEPREDVVAVAKVWRARRDSNSRPPGS